MFQTQLYRQDGQVAMQFRMTIWRLREEKILYRARPYLQNNPYMTLLLNHADNTGNESVSDITHTNIGNERLILNPFIN